MGLLEGGESVAHRETGISTFLISFHVRYYAASCREADE